MPEQTPDPDAPSPPAPGPFRPGDRLGHYRIEGVLGAGAMGVVYRATNLKIGRTCVLKLLSDARLEDPSFLDRFRVEARAAGRLHHPNVVTVYRVGEEGGHHFIEMEHVPGRSLKEILLEVGTLDPLRATEIILQVAEAVRVAHDEGVAHRDLKPANIMITPDGTVKVTDFGLAKDLEDPQGHTRPGQVVGTPYYMAPEVFLGLTTDLRSDFYALGVTFYLMVTGRFPLAHKNVLEMVRRRRTEKPTPPHVLDKSIPLGVSYVVMRLLAPDPDDRYPDAQSLLNEMKALHAFLRAEVGLVAACRILVFTGGGAYESHALTGQVCTVGRAPGNNIRTRDARMSAHHFRIVSSGRRLLVEDMRSRNGTRLNARLVEREELQHGDLIQAGETLFLVQGTGEYRRTRRLASLGGARMEAVVGEIKPFSLGRGGVTLGRATAADVPADDRALSEYHAHLHLDGDRLCVHDLRSRTGTFVGGRRIRRKHLRSGETVRMGGIELRFVLGAPRRDGGRPAPEAASVPVLEEVPEPSVPDAAVPAEAAGRPRAAPDAAPPFDSPTDPLAPAAAPAAPVADGPCLVVVSAAGAGRTFACPEKPQVVGRGGDADIRIEDKHLAERHAVITRRGQRLEVVDVSGGEGISVNGRPVRRTLAQRGDVIQMGSTRLEVC